jgi:hypothetical protein
VNFTKISLILAAIGLLSYTASSLVVYKYGTNPFGPNRIEISFDGDQRVETAFINNEEVGYRGPSQTPEKSVNSHYNKNTKVVIGTVHSEKMVESDAPFLYNRSVSASRSCFTTCTTTSSSFSKF